jgi:ribulose-phosphate 3-epimerase
MSSSNRSFELYASAISTSPVGFFKNLGRLPSLGVDGIHFDVMDGSFVPRLGLFPEFLEDIRANSSLPIEVHMMMENPEPYIEDFVRAGATSIIPHIESLKHVSRVITRIKEVGAQAGVALNPGTDLRLLEEIADQLDTIVLMAINPGIVGHAFIDKTLNKVGRLTKILSELSIAPTIEIDGGVTFHNASAIAASGNGHKIRLICGAGTIFHKSGTLDQNVTRLFESLTN